MYVELEVPKYRLRIKSNQEPPSYGGCNSPNHIDQYDGKVKDGKVEWSANPKRSTNCKVVKIFSTTNAFFQFSQNTNLGVLYIRNDLRKVFILDSYILMPTIKSHIVRYACVIWLLFLIGRLYIWMDCGQVRLFEQTSQGPTRSNRLD